MYLQFLKGSHSLLKRTSYAASDKWTTQVSEKCSLSQRVGISLQPLAFNGIKKFELETCTTRIY